MDGAGTPPRGVLPTATRAVVAATHAVDRVIGALCQAVVLLTGSALLGVLAANVVARYVLATGGFDWAQEVPERLFPWFIMAGVVLAGQHGGHVAVEWILPKLPLAGRRWLLAGVHVLVAATYLWLVRVALEVADITAVEMSPVLGLPTSLGYYALAAGAGLLALVTLGIALRIALLGADAVPQPHVEDLQAL